MTDEMLLACPLSSWTGNDSACRWCNGTLYNDRRRWCSQGCGETAWANHSWRFARAARLRRDGFACVRCGARKLAKIGKRLVRTRLDVHHRVSLKSIGVKRSDSGCHHHQDGLLTLCGNSVGTCHHAEHHGLAAAA